jgi:hypothetical protein
LAATDNAPEFLLGAFVGEGNIETFWLYSSATAITKGDPVQLVDASTEPGTVTNWASGKVSGFALRSYAADATGNTTVDVVVHGKVKLACSGAKVTAGYAIKGASAHYICQAAITVTIPTGTTTVTSTSAQPSMTVESGIACGVALQSSQGVAGDCILCIVNCL